MQFDGRFNDEIRNELHARRLALGVGCSQMAQRLGVSWSTYRKWECGPIVRCNTKYVSRIEAVLNGVDDWGNVAPYVFGCVVDEGDKAVNHTLTSLGLTCNLVSEKPELSKQFYYRLGCAFERAIAAVLTLD